MDRQSSQTIHRLCDKDDLREKAELLFHSIKAKTARGSGFELGQKTIAIPAISSLLASEKLGYSDVSEKIAQAASCLNPKEFQAALSTVRAVLAHAAKEKERFKVTYASLVHEGRHSRGDFMVECMQDVEAALVLSGSLRGNLRPPNDVVTITIYCWTCKVLALKRHATAITQGHRINEDDYQEVTEALDSSCQNIAQEIRERVKQLRASAKASRLSPNKVKSSKLPSPSKPSASPRKASTLPKPSPAKTPGHKRKVTFSPVKDVDMDLDYGVEDTPSKRQKFSSPHKYSDSAAFSAFQQAVQGEDSESAHSGVSLSSKSTLQLLQNSQSEDEVEPMTTAEDDETDTEAIIPTTDGYSSSDADADIPDVEMSDTSSSSPTRSSAEPMTPHRAPYRSKRAKGTPSKLRSVKSTRTANEDEDMMRRRCRPVLLEHKQWIQRDARLDREWKLREQWVREMIEKLGSRPFESITAQRASL